MSKLTVIILIGVVLAAAGAVALDGWKHYASLTQAEWQAGIAECRRQGHPMHTGRFDMFGAMVEIICLDEPLEKTP